MPELIAPIPHLNGTSRNQLISDYADASVAVSMALHALAFTAPNMRDYYTRPNGVWESAHQQYVARCEALRKVHEELITIAEMVQAQ